MQYGNIIGLVLVGIFVQAPALWLAGRFIVGSEKAKFMDAVWITILGGVLNAVIAAFIGGEIAGLVQLVAYLYLVKQYYETGWVQAAIISVLMVVILVVAVFVLALIGVSIGDPSMYGLV
ncbi:hypothetical protein GF326_04785 [Candidatus Bathyarchaeota archaeon]|nr:hypothetical protein [Candidatus Bathyarchaeota archaeon]